MSDSESSEKDVEFAVYTVFMIILIPGLVCNLLSLAVWVTAAASPSIGLTGRPDGSARMYAVLCLSDSLAIINYIVMYARTLQYFPDTTCDRDIFQFIGDIFCYYSDYVLVIIGLQPLVSVWRPFSSGTLCSAGHQWAALAAAFLVRLLTSAPFGVIYIVAFRGCTTGWSHLLWFDSPHDFVNYVKTVGYVALGTDLLPLLLLLIVNGLLLRFLWSQFNQTPPDSPTSTRLDTAKRRATQMVVAVSIPAILKYILVQTVNIHDVTQTPYDQALSLCRDFIIIVSACINVVFYSCFGERFRGNLVALWNKLILKMTCPRRRNSAQTATTGLQMYNVTPT